VVVRGRVTARTLALTACLRRVDPT
jgi:hypothetical protein